LFILAYFGICEIYYHLLMTKNTAKGIISSQ